MRDVSCRPVRLPCASRSASRSARADSERSASRSAGAHQRGRSTVAIATPVRNRGNDEIKGGTGPEGSASPGGAGDGRGGPSADRSGTSGQEASPEALATLVLEVSDEYTDASDQGDSTDELPPISSPGALRTSKRGGKRLGAGRKSGSARVAPGSKPGAAQTVSTARPKLTADTQAAGALLALAEGGLVLARGPIAQLTPFERSTIEPPLGRMLARMAPESAARFAAFADPIALLMGVIAYATRVFVLAPKPAAPAPVRSGPQPTVLRAVPTAPSAPITHDVVTQDDLEIFRELTGE